MLPSPIAPGGHGPLIEPEGGDDGLQRTAMAEQGDHERHHVERSLEAVQRGVAGGDEGLATGGTAIPLLLAAMNADVAQARLPACGAAGVVAESGLRVHRCISRGTTWRSCP